MDWKDSGDDFCSVIVEGATRSQVIVDVSLRPIVKPHHRNLQIFEQLCMCIPRHGDSLQLT